MKIYKYTALVIVLFCSFLSSDCFAKSYICRFYEHADMGGGYFEDGAGSRNRLETDWNDKVSSVRIENGYKVTIYEHNDFSGKKQTLYGKRGGTLYNLTNTGFNDMMSSYKITGSSDNGGDICTFYEHADRGGAHLEGELGSQSRIPAHWNDKISSVRIKNGYKVTIYEHADFSGKKQTLYGERGGTLYNLTDTNFNDVLSSYRVERVSSDRHKTREKKDRYKDRYRKDRDREQYRRSYCIFYEHADKQGAYFHSNTEKQSSLDIKWNDRISSVWVRNGYALTIYEHAGYGGRKETLHGRKDGALFNLTDMNFNDMISSYRIEKISYERDKYKTPGKKDRYKDSHWKDWEPHKGNYCTFYKHANKKGAYFHGKTGRHPFVGDNWNDEISSVWVRNGYAVTIYENAGYGGRSETLHGKKGGALFNLTDMSFN
ncbi:MAG: hypothetical protein GY795_07200, partial [Desulfobacterales bacterium]|nr:hypothetical protein [Desulfobacterales bacterium]